MKVADLLDTVSITEQVSLFRVKPMRIEKDGRYVKEYGNELLCASPLGAIPMKYADRKITSIQSGNGELIIFVES